MIRPYGELWYDADGDLDRARREIKDRSDELVERACGWLRVLLGWAQMVLAAAAVVALLAVGFHPVTWALAAVAVAATVTSRLIYRGRSDTNLNERK